MQAGAPRRPGPGCRTFARSHPRCWGGISRPPDSRVRTRLRFRLNSKPCSRTAARCCARNSRSGRNRCVAPPRGGRLVRENRRPRCVKTRRLTAPPTEAERRPIQTPNAEAPHRTAHRPGSYSFASAIRARTSTT